MANAYTYTRPKNPALKGYRIWSAPRAGTGYRVYWFDYVPTRDAGNECNSASDAEREALQHYTQHHSTSKA